MNAPVSAQTPMTMRRLLALATLATAGSVAATSAFAGPGDGHMHGQGMAGPGLSQRMLEKVGASSEQRASIEQIMSSARSDLRAQHEQGRALQTQMRSLFAQADIDESAIEALRQQMLTQHDAASRRMTQAMVEASRVLTAEQRQQLATMMAERAGRPGRPGADDRRHGG
ncbi:MAG: Spy/CpxP family protein refolding chaperone [Burkholderiaceae bacterium]|nr:Spy/CpxP family protein refolding chaperone [Rhodoferax sp.]MCP5284194.1 Spy/CpxP family protein refolding chaperone [Burkholderiaceae bacterium]